MIDIDSYAGALWLISGAVYMILEVSDTRTDVDRDRLFVEYITSSGKRCQATTTSTRLEELFVRDVIMKLT